MGTEVAVGAIGVPVGGAVGSGCGTAEVVAVGAMEGSSAVVGISVGVVSTTGVSVAEVVPVEPAF